MTKLKVIFYYFLEGFFPKKALFSVVKVSALGQSGYLSNEILKPIFVAKFPYKAKKPG